MLRDACNRAVDLSDRVVAGLPEAQAYLFLEANRPPADLLLSCLGATKRTMPATPTKRSGEQSPGNPATDGTAAAAAGGLRSAGI